MSTGSTLFCGNQAMLQWICPPTWLLSTAVPRVPLAIVPTPGPAAILERNCKPFFRAWSRCSSGCAHCFCYGNPKDEVRLTPCGQNYILPGLSLVGPG